MSGGTSSIGWFGIFRLGLVQACLGSIVVLTTSTLNRIMVVELALPAVLPGALVAAHYFVQILRPRFGYGSDVGVKRTPWIIGGMLVLASGGTLAAIATAIMAQSVALGIALAVVAFVLIGAGVGASGTCLLVLLASSVSAQQRAGAATLTWVMMIFGFALTAGLVGAVLDPFSFTRLIMTSAGVGAIAVTLTVIALFGLERRSSPRLEQPTENHPSFRQAIGEVLAEPHTRRFALFVFVSMLAYSAQDLVLEPFAGAVFGLTPGQSTQLGGMQHGGVLAGMFIVAIVGSVFKTRNNNVLRNCMIAGCIGSAALLTSLGASVFVQGDWPLYANVFALGVANGAFAVAAIGSMMGLVSQGTENRGGVRMGVWGAAQAIAFGLGGIVGTLAVDITRWLSGSAGFAYALVFLLQAILFLVAVYLAVQVAPKAAKKFNESGFIADSVTR